MSGAPSAPSATAPIVFVGGGFGGLYTALALADQRQHPPLLLIEPKTEFLFLPLLYELLSGELRRWEIAPRYDSLLAGRGIAWLRDSVVQIDSANRCLHTASGRQLRYSQLVLATGAGLQSFGIPGVIEHAIGFRSLADVERLQNLVAELRQRRQPLQRLAIVGAGPSGVDLACKLADMLAGAAVVELIEQGPRPLPQARAFNREQASRALQRRDVRLRCNCRVLEVGSDQIRLQGSAGAERLAVEAVVWTAGLAFAPPAIQPPPLQDNKGRLVVNEHLQLVDQPAIFALGDIAAHHGGASSSAGDLDPGAGPGDGLSAWPATAQVAFQQASCLATNLIQARREGPLQPFHFNDLGEMLSLGRGEATLVGSGLTLAGAAAFQLRRLAYLTRLPGRSHQLRVAAGWLADW
jgi:demethylphylloquinone reductase